MPQPNVILKLCDLPKKSAIAFIYRIHFLGIVNAFPDTTLCFTDGSKMGDRIGFAYSISDQSFPIAIAPPP